MEENRRFSWSDLFIKVILVIIFVLLAVWLLSVSNKKMTNSLSVLTDKIFAENIDRMKEVGKEYFTIERLPQKIGEIKIITLQEMYDKNLILPVKDKNGDLCDADDSYISIEKFDNEYQMKVNLECGDEENFIIVIMGCYDYCDGDICEKEEVKEEEYVKGETQIEYEYKKTVNGKWSDYGVWSEWSKVEIAGNDYRQVEIKKENEEYTYDKVVNEVVYEQINAVCPEGYTMSDDGTECYKTITSTLTEKPVCPTVSGYVLVSQDGFDCNYSRTSASALEPVCPTVSGYTLISQDGFDCNYSKTTTSTVDSVCPTKSGYTLTSQDGFTCNYSKTTTSTVDSVCPTKSGYTFVSQDGFTCNYSKTTTSTKDPVCSRKSGWDVSRSGFTCNYSRTVEKSYQVQVTYSKTCYSQKVVKPCASCAPVTQNVPYDCSTTGYETRYEYETETSRGTATCPSGYSKSGKTCVKSSTETSTGTATCPSGYSKSGNSCVKSITETSTGTATCPSGYSKSGNGCVKSTTSTIEKSASCPSGYSKSGTTCVKLTTNTIEKTASCPSEYSKSGNSCVKNTNSRVYKDLIKSCPTGYSMNANKTQCSKVVEKIEKVTDFKEVTYYRYRIREYIGGSVDYKWSTSKNDKDLLNAGYKLTGRTR